MKSLRSNNVTALLLVVLFIVLFVAACGGSSDDPAESNLIPAPTSEIALEENLRLGVEDPLFSYISDVKADDNGFIYVSEPREPSNVYKFAPDGELVGSIGAHGEGPGEYRRASTILTSPDSLAVWDSGLDQFVVYEPDGSFRQKGERLSTGNPTSLSIVGKFEGGLFVSETPYFTTGMNEGEVGEIQYRILDAAGTLSDPFWSTRMSEFLMHSTSNTISISSPPFGRQTICASTLDKMYCAWSESIELHGFSADGDTLPPLRVAYEPVPISASAAREALDGVDDLFKSRVTISDTYPALSDVTGDDRGRLWIKVRTTEAEDETTFWIVDPSDQSTVSAHIDGNVSLLSIRNGSAYGRLTTPDGEQLVVRYSVG